MCDRTVIITGASRGIGKATAERFYREGWNVLVNYMKSEKEAYELQVALKKMGTGAVELFRADVSKRSEVDLMVAHCIDIFGGVDVLINNAGISRQTLFTDISSDEWDDIMNVNLKGVFNCCQSVLPLMLKRKSGRIINVSSIWGLVGASCEVHYSAAKAAVIGLTRALAKELGPSNIQVNCVCPGIIRSDMNTHLSAEDIQELEYVTPLMRLGTPEDVSHCIYFLASPEASFFTGQVLSPNGGFVI